jgi:Leucine-rich repeat (LRR) protein
MPEIPVSEALTQARQEINNWKFHNPPLTPDPEPLNLSSIGLTDEDLTTLLPELQNIGNLSRLELVDNELAILPPGIGQLNNLISLKLENNQLTTLPPEIGQLSNLRELRIDSNNLNTLPPEISLLNNLFWLEISKNQLTTLPIEIGQLENLKALGLNNNRLTVLPPEIAQLNRLEALGLNDNRLTRLPPGIGMLDRIKVLLVNNNQLLTLPPEIGHLRRLEMLEVENNLITALPEQIDRLQNIQTFNINRNPLSEDSLALLQDSFPENWNIDLVTMSENFEKLRILYPQESTQKLFQKDSNIGNLFHNGPKFTDGNDQNPGVLRGDEVVDSFLSQIKVNHGGPDVTGHYHNSAIHLLDRALGNDTLDSDAALTQIASSLGNCPTPVSDLLEKTGVQLALESNKEISGTLTSMLHRQAFEELIKKERIVPFSSAEPIETLQGLTNALFMQEAETARFNTLRIQGHRPRIASKTANIEFAFSQVTERMRDSLAKHCCKTDNKNKPLKDSQGSYQLDPEKYFTITQRYLEKQGILDKKAQARKHHMQEIKGLMAKPYNKDLSIDFDLVNFEKIEDDLRLSMRTIPEKQINTVIEQHMQVHKDKMEEVRTAYGLPKPPDAGQTTNIQPVGVVTPNNGAASLENMMIPVNEDRRNNRNNRENRNNPDNTHNRRRRRTI